MKTVTKSVLFADIKGFSSLTMPQLKQFGSSFLPAVADRVFYNECGAEEKNLWGDGIMAAFPSVRHAAQTALELRDFVSRYSWSEISLPEMDIRISVHQGEMLSGVDPLTRRPLVLGNSINQAARIEPVTEVGNVWVTEPVVASLMDPAAGEHKFACDEVGEVNLPKAAGKLKVSRIRWVNEEPLSESEREAWLAANAARHQRQKQKPELSPLQVVCGVVTRKLNGSLQVALVKRIPGDDDLDWMFPSVAFLPNYTRSFAIWREVLRETGLSCMNGGRISSRIHPKTGAHCHYYSLVPTDPGQEVFNADSNENLDATWMDLQSALNCLGPDLSTKVRRFLERMAK